LAQGPEEKFGFPGRMSGVVAPAMKVLPYRRKASRWGDVTHHIVYASDLTASMFFRIVMTNPGPVPEWPIGRPRRLSRSCRDLTSAITLKRHRAPDHIDALSAPVTGPGILAGASIA
jgi:hypothetical protein